jgi:hypothetical protein
MNQIILENPINYGFEVYIEGALVTRLIYESGIWLQTTEGEYNYVLVTLTGALVYEY